MEERIRTFCRVCEPACGLVARVRDGRLVRVEPDREHPITRGFACPKGLAAIDIHHDPDRLDRPLRRTRGGGFEPVSWDDALDGIAAGLRSILERHGADAVGSYIGNPSAFNSLLGPAAGAFFQQLGVRRTFSSGTQDCANKFAGSEAVFGSSTMHPIPDLEHTDYLLILGENPRVSHMSFLAIADPIAVLKRARARGARIRFINPRRIESEQLGESIRIRPDTDLYLLAAMLCEIDRDPGFRPDVIAAHARHVEELRAFVRRFPPERAAGVTGIPADTIRRLAREFATAPSASIHMSTGVNMGRQGTLAYWLLHMLVFVTGNLDRPGGNLLSLGFYPNAKAGRRDFEDSFRDTPWGPLRRGTLPGNLLAEEIRAPGRPIRGFFVVAGNPLLSIAGEARLREAFESLELLVAIDLYRSATGELAHYLLPAADMFERADINLTGLGLQHHPYVQWTDPVVEPQAERREEWWIFGRLCQRLGYKSLFDAGEHPDPWGRIEHMLSARGHSLGELRDAPHRVIDFGPHRPGEFFTKQLQTPDRRVDCCPTAFAAALERAERIFRELEAEPASQLKLISGRESLMHNSWFANVARFKRGDGGRNYLYMHPEDAAERGLLDRGRVRVASAHGALEVELRTSADLRRGSVALVHGWGNRQTAGMSVAQRTAGVNSNRLLPTGAGSFEPLSSQAHMTGVPIEVSPI